MAAIESISGLFCTHCTGEVELSHRYCTNCGFEIEFDEVLIRYYFCKGYEYKAIISFLFKHHGMRMSLRTLKSRLEEYNLRRYSGNVDVQEVRNEIEQILDGSGCLVGYRSIWHTLRTRGHTVPRALVEELLKRMDAEGCALRRAKRLKRRSYTSPGPNFCWHMDGYDKLKPYGFAVHGCIDGWSRKLLWLEVCRSNNDPIQIGHLYVACVQSLGGCPKKMRTDCGTENGIVAAAQCYFTADESGHIYGTSPHNQRIEAWWSFLRKSASTWWMNFFRDLMEQGLFTPGIQLQEECLWYCFSDLLQNEFDEITEHWNAHYIRRSRFETISGRPNELYFLPELHDGEDYIHPVDNEQCIYVKANYLRDIDNGNDHQRYFDYAVATAGMQKPTHWREALELYNNLLQFANS